MVGTLWRRALPSSVKQAVAHYEFTKANLPAIMQVADDVFLSTRPNPAASVAALSTTMPNIRIHMVGLVN